MGCVTEQEERGGGGQAGCSSEEYLPHIFVYIYVRNGLVQFYMSCSGRFREP